MEGSRHASGNGNGKRINDMAQKYGALFYGSARLLAGMKGANGECDEKAIGELLNSREFLRLLDGMKRVLSEEHVETAAKSRLQRDYSNIILDIVAAIYVSDEIGEVYTVDGSAKSLFKLDVEIASLLMKEPKQARRAVALMNKVAANSYAISEIMKRNGRFFPEEHILSQLPAEFCRKLTEKVKSGNGNGYKSFVSSCFAMVEGSNRGYGIALVSRSDIINGLEDDRLALNRLLGMHYFISGVSRR
jgi:hypothetical protein